MKIDAAVKQETLRIALGTAVFCALTIAVYLILGKFNYTVILGTLWGGGYSVLNFFLLGCSVQKAAEKSRKVKQEQAASGSAPSEPDADTDESDEEKERNKAVSPEVKNYVRISYYARLLLTAAVLIIGIVAPVFDTVAVAISIIFPRLFILVDNLLLKRKAKDS